MIYARRMVAAVGLGCVLLSAACDGESNRREPLPLLDAGEPSHADGDAAPSATDAGHDAAVDAAPDASVDAGSDAGDPGEDPIVLAATGWFDVERRGYDAISYALQADLPNDDPFPAVFHLTLALKVTDHDLPFIVLDSEVDVHSVRIGDQELPFRTSAAHLVIDARNVILAHDTEVELSIDYRVNADDFGGGIYHMQDTPCGGFTYTFSEPQLGRFWLPGHHIAYDRATFSVDLRVPKTLDVIANGERSLDQTEGKLRHVRYETSFTLPTYTMAFAMADFVRVPAKVAASVPVEVWAQRCAGIDAQAMADTLAELISRFEPRFGPYPFARYTSVAVPAVGNGSAAMENVGITFVNENTFSDAAIQAHELAHQWFGDYVTVHGHRDAWFKEGMATLVQDEYQTQLDDPSSELRYGGSLMQFERGGVPYDPGYDENNAYIETADYDPAALLLNQVRALVGEDVFWSTWRTLFHDHAFGFVTTLDVIQAFSPALTPAQSNAWLTALEAEHVPFLDATRVDGPDSTELTFTLTGNGQVFAPVQLTAVAPDGSVTHTTLLADTPTKVSVIHGGYVAIDEPDMLPALYDTNYDCDPDVTPYLRPTATEAIKRFDSGPARTRYFADECAPKP